VGKLNLTKQEMKLDISCLDRKNFKAEEFIASNTAARLGIDNNIYDQEVLDNLMLVADKAQEIRSLLGYPLKINSGYRCLKLNQAVGSKGTSQHLKGQALDFVCQGFGSPEKIVKFLKSSGVEADQCLIEFNRWVHISIKKEGNRNQFGKITKKGFEILNG